MSKILPSFRRLRWKLTFSYTAVTVAVLLTLGAAMTLILVITSTPSGWLDLYQQLAVAQAAEARPVLEAALPDSTLAEFWLRNAIPNDLAVIVNLSGEVLVANSQEAAAEAPLGQPFVDPKAPDESRRLIDKALGGKQEVLGLNDGTILAVAPIPGEGENVLGALYVRGFSDTLVPGRRLGVGLAALIASTIVLTVAAGLIGTLFGRVTSRGLVRRLENLERVSEAWGQGDFSATVDDTSPDEIGQLARRMSQMAGQVQDLLQARQDLATLKERNRWLSP